MLKYKCIKKCQVGLKIWNVGEIMLVRPDADTPPAHFALLSEKGGTSIMTEIKTGVQTTEFKIAQNSSKWGAIAMVLGAVTTIGSTLLPALGANSKIGIMAGAVIAFAGIVQKTLVDLGYIKGRSDVKVAASLGENK